MGLFSRKESAASTGRRARSSSSEAQVDDMRSRARRRLIGALALVVAAVIIVPMLVDTSVPDQQPVTPIVVPAIVPPAVTEPNLAANTPATTEAQTGSVTTVEPAPSLGTPDSGHSDRPAVQGVTPSAEINATVPSAPTAKPDNEHENKSEHVSKPKIAEKTIESKAKSERTDDGSVAIALLEGRKPAQRQAQNAQGNYVLQIAAYTTDKDANSRRDQLVAAGVTNTYVEHASSGGKSTYRLRVGPFPTREAAQASLTRLRALGYKDGFISTK